MLLTINESTCSGCGRPLRRCECTQLAPFGTNPLDYLDQDGEPLPVSDTKPSGLADFDYPTYAEE